MAKFILFTLSVLITSLLQIGCASHGFNRGALQKQIGVEHAQFDDKDIKDAYNKRPNLPKPFKLAVYFKGSPLTSWRWTPEDKATLARLSEDLQKEKLVSDVFPLIDSVVEHEDLRSLRLAAAKHQADALLIVSGAGQIDRYINHWGWTYALLLPTFFVKGSEADTLFIASATLWDVKNEYLYLTAESEGTTSHHYIAAFGDTDKELLHEAKAKSLQALKTELEKMIRGAKL